MDTSLDEKKPFTCPKCKSLNPPILRKTLEIEYLFKLDEDTGEYYIGEIYESKGNEEFYCTECDYCLSKDENFNSDFLPIDEHA